MKFTRRFRKDDLIGMVIMCPNCKVEHTIVEVEGPYIGYNLDYGIDLCWILTFDDGEKSRFWEEGQGIEEDLPVPVKSNPSLN